MKNTLKLISKILSYGAFWTMGMMLMQGLLELDLIKILAAIIIYLSVGTLLRWVSLSGKLRKQKTYIILSEIFVIIMIVGVVSVIVYATIENMYPIITYTLIYGLVFIAFGILGTYLTNKIKIY